MARQTGRNERITPQSEGLTVLVTGATGAIGRYVIEELIDRSCRVAALTRRPSGNSGNRQGLTWHTADIQDIDNLSRIIQETGARRIMHLAASILNSETDVPGALAVNSGGTAAVLEAAHRNGIERVVYTSSKAVFGPISGEWGHPQYRPVPEDHPRHPRSVYALTKMVGEDLATFYREGRGLDVVSVRFGTSCGPGKGPQHGGAKRLAQLIENPVLGLPIEVRQGSDQRDDIMYTGEVAQGLVTICLAGGPTSGMLHLSSGRLVSLPEIAEAVREEIPDAEITIGPGLDYMGFGGIYCQLDNERARREVGYEPRYDLRGWVRHFIAHARQEAGTQVHRPHGEPRKA